VVWDLYSARWFRLGRDSKGSDAVMGSSLPEHQVPWPALTKGRAAVGFGSGHRLLLGSLVYFFSEGPSCLFKDPAEPISLLKRRACDLIT